MPMRVTTVRFSEDHWKQLERESTREGVSAAQFIRESTIMRTAYLMGQRGDAAFEDAAGRTTRPDAEARENGAQRRQALLDAAAAASDSDRLDALHATGLLDSDISPSFDRLARLASKVLNAPVALVSLVDTDRQFFKSCLGLPEPWASQRGTPLSHSFCQHAVATREPLIVEDSREHELLRDNPAIRDIGVIAYAGIPTRRRRRPSRIRRHGNRLRQDGHTGRQPQVAHALRSVARPCSAGLERAGACRHVPFPVPHAPQIQP